MAQIPLGFSLASGEVIPGPRRLPTMNLPAPAPVNVGDDLRNIARVFADRERDLQNKQDAIDLATLQSDYKLAHAELLEQASSEPDMEKREQLYQVGQAKLIESFPKRSSRQPVQMAMQQHLQQQRADGYLKFKQISVGIMQDQQLAALTAYEDTLVVDLSQAEKIAKAHGFTLDADAYQRRMVDQHTAYIDNLTEGSFPVLTLKQAEERKINFRYGLAKSWAASKAVEDPERLQEIIHAYLNPTKDTYIDPDTQRVIPPDGYLLQYLNPEEVLKFSEAAQVRIDRIEKERDKQAQEQRQAVVDMMMAGINTDPETTIRLLREAARGENPHLDPGTAAQLLRQAESPMAGDTAEQLDALQESYYKDDPVPNIAEDYLESLNNRRDHINRHITEIDQIIRELPDGTRPSKGLLSFRSQLVSQRRQVETYINQHEAEERRLGQAAAAEARQARQQAIQEIRYQFATRKNEELMSADPMVKARVQNQLLTFENRLHNGDDPSAVLRDMTEYFRQNPLPATSNEPSATNKVKGALGQSTPPSVPPPPPIVPEPKQPVRPGHAGRARRALERATPVD